MQDTGMRLVLLFCEAGFISEEEVKALVGEKAESKHLIDILSQDVSLKAVKDLLSLEIKLPFSRPREQEIQKVLGQSFYMSSDEILKTLKANKPDAGTIITMLQALSLLSPEKADEYRKEKEITGLDQYELLVEKGIITSGIISQFVREAKSDYSKWNRMSIALNLLEYNKLLTQSDYDEAKKEANNNPSRIPEILYDGNKINRQRVNEAIAAGLYLPHSNIASIEIEEKCLPLFPREFIRSQLFLPYKKKRSLLHIAIADLLNLSLMDALSLLSGNHILPVYVPQEDIIHKVNALFPIEKKAAPAQPAAPSHSREEYPSRVSDVEIMVDNVSTVQLVTSIIESAIGTRSTDIHLEPQEEDMRVRFRIDGSLHHVMKIRPELQLPVVSRIKVLSNMDVTERRRPQDGHFSLEVSKNRFDFRVSTLPTHLGEKVVIRVLDESTVVKGLSDLGLTDKQEEVLKNLITKPYGMILVTGPTGSGKTSTLYAGLNAVNKVNTNIVTIEDPVEYRLKGINQVQVDPNIDLTFATGLRSTLRQDPDVIMVGEIRDPETAQIAVRAALTGHLVFSTLHTNTSAGAVSALMHMGIQPYLLASSVIMVIAQRLVRVICTECKVTKKPSKEVLSSLGVSTTSRKKMYFGKGCDHCLTTGYYGRTGIFELLTVNDAIRQFIAEKSTEKTIYDKAVENGMMTLRNAAMEKVYQGTTTPDEVLRNVFLT